MKKAASLVSEKRRTLVNQQQADLNKSQILL
jgi:hypothetical protein